MQRIRFVRNLPVLTASAEVAAPPAPEERNALALWCILARLLARREVGAVARRLAQVLLAFGRVAFLFAEEIVFQILCNRIEDSLPFLTPSAEVAAPPMGVERDALARCCIHARLLTRRVVGDLARRLLHKDLASRQIAFLVP